MPMGSRGPAPRLHGRNTDSAEADDDDVLIEPISHPCSSSLPQCAGRPRSVRSRERRDVEAEATDVRVAWSDAILRV
jgi:hypothetical protein